MEEILFYPRVADFYKRRKGTRLSPSCAFPYEGQPKPVHSGSHRKIKLEVRETQFIENFKKQKHTHIQTSPVGFTQIPEPVKNVVLPVRCPSFCQRRDLRRTHRIEPWLEIYRKGKNNRAPNKQLKVKTYELISVLHRCMLSGSNLFSLLMGYGISETGSLHKFSSVQIYCCGVAYLNPNKILIRV